MGMYIVPTQLLTECKQYLDVAVIRNIPKRFPLLVMLAVMHILCSNYIYTVK